MLRNNFKANWKIKIEQAFHEDRDSKLGTYLIVNTDLSTPLYKNVFELEGVCLTRLRTGSHNLLIETGRCANPKIPREQRLCNCGTNIQTISHVLLECPL